METIGSDRPGRSGSAPTELAIQTFRNVLQGDLISHGDEGYEAARKIWNGLIDRKPALIARCTGVADVVQAVNFARAQGLLVAIRGGGHNVAGMATCDGGLVIDLSQMRGVHVDPVRRTARVQAGATWGDVDRETQVFGLATPGGIVSTTGVSGLTLSGGLSWQRRKHGMSIDNLLSVDVVTADGAFVRASAEENTDLFWAIRGGGGNFGVVTSLEFRLHPLGPDVMFLACLYPLDRLRMVMSTWREFVATAPDDATVDCLVWSIPDSPLFPEAVHRQPVVGVGGMFAGPADEGERLFEPLRSMASPVLDLSGIMPYTVVQRAYDPFFPTGTLRYYWKSIYLDSMSDDVINTVEKWAGNRSSNRTLFSIRHLQGAVGRVPPEATAFGDRSAPFLISVDSTWENAEEDERHIAWTQRVWREMQLFSQGKLYFNFPGFLEEGDALVRASYGVNYERLVQVKSRYDPTNLFRRNQNIKPSG